MEPNQAPGTPSPTFSEEDRRQLKEDVWARTLRYIVNATYVLLILNLLIFVGVGFQDYNQQMGEKIEAAGKLALEGQPAEGEPAAAERASPPVYLQAYLPILAFGFLVGIAGMFIHRKRTRRRRDRNYKGQLLCILLSVVGVVLYFMLA